MGELHNIIPFPNISSKANQLNTNALKKIFTVPLSISLTNIACLESSNPNRLLKTAIDLHRQLNNTGFLQMTQANQNLFNTIRKIKELESMTLFFPEVSNIKASLQEDLFMFIKDNPNMNSFFIFGSSMPFHTLKRKSLLTKDFSLLSEKVIQLDRSLIKIFNTSGTEE